MIGSSHLPTARIASAAHHVDGSLPPTRPPAARAPSAQAPRTKTLGCNVVNHRDAVQKTISEWVLAANFRPPFPARPIFLTRHLLRSPPQPTPPPSGGQITRPVSIAGLHAAP